MGTSGQQKETPQPGDTIEFDRGAYKHWGVAVGGGQVVHLTGHDGAGTSYWLGSTSEKGIVKMEPLEKVADNCTYRVNNEKDASFTPLPRDEIVRNAESRVGEEGKYSLSNANCEHFASEVRSGVPWSDQADLDKVRRLTAPNADLSLFMDAYNN